MSNINKVIFDIVERVINRWSNPGEIVYDPFAGLGTVPYCAVRMGRYGLGAELNGNYWRDSIAYCTTADQEVDAPTLFDAFRHNSLTDDLPVNEVFAICGHCAIVTPKGS